MANAHQIRDLIAETTTGSLCPRVPREVRDEGVPLPVRRRRPEQPGRSPRLACGGQLLDRAQLPGQRAPEPGVREPAEPASSTGRPPAPTSSKACWR